MKKYFITLALFFVSVNISLSQQSLTNETANHSQSDAPQGMMKSAFVDGGFGQGGMSLGFGFRYWNLGLSLGLSGIGKNLPPHSQQWIMENEIQDRYTYPSMWVTGDIYYFYDLNDEFTIFGNVGYGVGTDSILATKRGDTHQSKYFYRIENKSSVTFGAGVQYFLQNQIGLGLGYHNKRGIYAQVSYYWF